MSKSVLEEEKVKRCEKIGKAVSCLRSRCVCGQVGTHTCQILSGEMGSLQGFNCPTAWLALASTAHTPAERSMHIHDVPTEHNFYLFSLSAGGQPTQRTAARKEITAKLCQPRESRERVNLSPSSCITTANTGPLPYSSVVPNIIPNPNPPHTQATSEGGGAGSATDVHHRVHGLRVSTRGAPRHRMSRCRVPRPKCRCEN